MDGNLVVGIVVVLIVVCAVAYLIYNNRKGKRSCGCDKGDSEAKCNCGCGGTSEKKSEP